MSRLPFPLLLTTLILSTTQAVTLRLYPNFAEIRQDLLIKNRAFELNFTQAQLSNIVDGSLYLSGPRVLSQLQTQQNGMQPLERFEGQIVYLCEDGKVRPVRLIRASSGLIQDLKTRRYRSGITVDQLEFTQELKPAQENSLHFRYTLDASGPATLSLISRALNWFPRYVLSVTDYGSKLEAWADLKNRDVALKVSSSELIAGQVELVSANPDDSNYANVIRPRPIMPPAPASPALMSGLASTPTVQAGREQTGLYAYKLSQGFTLPKDSVYSLPFLKSTVTVKRVARLETDFYAGFQKGKFQRLYRLTSNVLLPAGTLTVRDAGRVVGSQALPDLAAGEKRELQLGQDPDLSFTRFTKVTTSSRNKVYGTLQRHYTYTTYSVTLQFENAKSRPVPFEYLERLEGQNIALEGDASRTARGLSLRGTLPAKGKLQRRYKVTFIEVGSAYPFIKP